MANALVVRDGHTSDLLHWSLHSGTDALTVLGYMAKPRPATGGEAAIPPELSKLGIVLYDWRNLQSYVHIALTHAWMWMGEAVSWPHDDVDKALLDAQGKVKYAAERIGKAEAYPDKLAVDECIGSLRPGLRELGDALNRIQVKPGSVAVIAPNAANTLTSVPVAFCVLTAEPGEWFDREIQALKKQRQQGAEQKQEHSEGKDAKKAAGKEAGAKAGAKVGDAAGIAAAAANAKVPAPAKRAGSLSEVDAAEEELERQEEAEEAAQKTAQKAAAKKGEGGPAWWDADPTVPKQGYHERFLSNVYTRTVKNGHFLLLRGSNPDQFEEARVGHTDDAGRLFWDDTSQPAFLPPGQTYWCFWAYDRNEFAGGVAALTGPAAQRASSRARKYGLFQFVTSLSHLEDRIGQKAVPSIASQLASQLFPRDGVKEEDPLRADGFRLRMRSRATWLFSGLLKEPQGFHVKSTGLEEPGTPPPRDDVCWFVAQRPSINVIYLVEMLRLYIDDAKLRSAKDRATLQQMVDLVQESSEAALGGKRIHAFDLPAMRVMMGIGINREFGGDPTWWDEKRSTLTIRADVRQYFGKLVEYVRASAMATSKDGRWVDVDLMEHALASDSETIYSNCDAARARIRDEFCGPVFPGWLRHYGQWAYRDHLLDYFAFYQYHRRILAAGARETKNRDHWYEKWQRAAKGLEARATQLEPLVKELMESLGSGPAAWADIAWHETVKPGTQTQADHVDFDHPRARLHFRYIWAAAEAKYAWWESFPAAETPEFEESKVELRKVAKATFDTVGRADELLKMAIELRHGPFAQLAAASLTEACAKMEGISALIDGRRVESGMGTAYFVVKHPDLKSNILKLVLIDGIEQPVGELSFTVESLKLAKSEAGRNVILHKLGAERIPLAETAAMKELAKRHLAFTQGVPIFFNGLFQLTILGCGAFDFAESNKGAKPIFQLAGEVGYAMASVQECIEVIGLYRHKWKVFAKHFGAFTKPYTAVFGAVEMFQVIAEGATCYFGEAPAADWRGDTVRVWTSKAKGVLLMGGGVVAIGVTVWEITQVGLTAAAFGPGGWVVCAVVLGGLVIDGIAELFGEKRTFLTELEEKAFKAVQQELENGSNLDGFHLSRSNTLLWRAWRVADTLLKNRPYLLPTTAYFPALAPAEARAV